MHLNCIFCGWWWWWWWWWWGWWWCLWGFVTRVTPGRHLVSSGDNANYDITRPTVSPPQDNGTLCIVFKLQSAWRHIVLVLVSIHDDLVARCQNNIPDVLWEIFTNGLLQEHFLHDMCKLEAHKKQSSWLNGWRAGDSKSGWLARVCLVSSEQAWDIVIRQ